MLFSAETVDTAKAEATAEAEAAAEARMEAKAAAQAHSMRLATEPIVKFALEPLTESLSPSEGGRKPLLKRPQSKSPHFRDFMIVSIEDDGSVTCD